MGNKTSHINSMPDWRKIFAAIFLVLSVIPGMILLRMCIDLYDEPYQILNAMDSQSAPMAPLSAYAGNIFGNIFGWNQLSFRYLSYAMTQGAICLGGVWVYMRRRNASEAMTLTGCLLLANGSMRTNAWHYSWDSLSFLLLTLTAIAFMEYCRKSSAAKVAIMAILSTLAIGSRMPDAVIVPLVAIAIIFCAQDTVPRNRRLKFVAMYLVLTAVATWVMLSLLYYSAGGFAGYLRAVNDNSISNHSPGFLVYSFVVAVVVLYILVAFISFILRVCKVLIDKGMSPAVSVSFTALTAIVVTFIGIFKLYNYSLPYLYEALFWTGICYLLYTQGKRWDRDSYIFIFLALFSFVHIIGSNLHLYKNLGIYLMPILYVLLCKHRIKVRYYVLLAVYIIPLCMLYSYSECYSPYDGIEDNDCTERIQGTVFDGIYDTPKRLNAIHLADSTFTDIKNKGCRPVIVPAYMSNHGWIYLACTENEKSFRHYWGFNKFKDYTSREAVKAIAQDIQKGAAKKIVLMIDILRLKAKVSLTKICATILTARSAANRRFRVCFVFMVRGLQSKNNE